MGNCFTWAKKIVLLFMQYGVLIYEDNVKLRLSLAQLLAEDGAFTVAGAFNHCDNVVEEMIALAPALIVMDIDMPGIGGIKGVKQAKEIFPEVKIIMHTVFDDDSRIFESICAGADGYLLKNINPVKFIDELKRVMVIDNHGEIRAKMRVLSESYNELGVTLTVRSSEEILAQIKKKLIIKKK